MRRRMLYSIDVEEDLHTGNYEGIRKGLAIFEKICDKYGIKPTLFIVASAIEKNKNIFKKLDKKGWDISLHGYSHKRFDEMSYSEKEEEIKKSLEIFRKNLGIKPKGFRAPQHSIDDETLNLLEKYGFEYDSSYTPFNLLQLFFFPRKIKQFLKQFFSKTTHYKIRENLTEIPVPALLLPPVSLFVRVFPLWSTKIYFHILKLIYEEPVFYAHSWDFIEMKESKTDRIFSHSQFIKKLEDLIKYGI